VENLVRFEGNDLFQANFREATVVTLFLFRSTNLTLRPKLLPGLEAWYAGGLEHLRP
jgi:hypothetical protein